MNNKEKLQGVLVKARLTGLMIEKRNPWSSLSPDQFEDKLWKILNPAETLRQLLLQSNSGQYVVVENDGKTQIKTCTGIYEPRRRVTLKHFGTETHDIYIELNNGVSVGQCACDKKYAEPSGGYGRISYYRDAHCGSISISPSDENFWEKYMDAIQYTWKNREIHMRPIGTDPRSVSLGPGPTQKEWQELRRWLGLR